MTQYTLDLVGVLALVIQVALPLLVGLVTRMSTHPGAKALLLLALTALTQFFTLWYQHAHDGIPFAGRLIFFNVVLGFVISVVAHYGLWRPTTATARVQAAFSPGTSRRVVP